MRIICTVIALSILIISAIPAIGENGQTNKNASVFEGDKFAYVIYPPNGFKLVTDEAADSGYSLAFIPKGQTYSNANIVIDVNVFKVKKKNADAEYLKELIKDDINQMKNHFGKGLRIIAVDSVYNTNKRLLPTFYFNDPNRFIPTVMMSYFNGQSEIVIFQLSIAQNQPRFKAEEIYLNCVSAFKTLIKEDIEQRNRRLKADNK